MEGLILYDTSELLRPMPRVLHAALMEVCGNKVRVSPKVAQELAQRGAVQSRNAPFSVAEDLLRPGAPPEEEERRAELEQQAWWAAEWRDPKSPYEKLALSPEQRQLQRTLLAHITRDCFPVVTPQLLADNPDTQIICETIALGGKMLLTSNIRTIDHIEVNRWAVENAPRFGFHPEPVIFQADAQIVRWTESRVNAERWIQAGMLVSWPGGADADPDRVLSATRDRIGKLAATDWPLPDACGRLLNELDRHPNPRRLVEQTRGRLPSATLASEQQHPTYPSR